MLGDDIMHQGNITRANLNTRLIKRWANLIHWAFLYRDI
jgi:hypothetical protein